MYKSAFAVYGDMSNLDSSNPIVIFNGTEVEDSDQDDKWTYSDVRYWFPDREFSFVALYPKTFAGLSNLKYESNRLAFTYTLPSNYSDASDIMIAGHRRIATASNMGNMVELSFGHIMSRLNFVAKIDPIAKDLGIEIKKITIKGVASKASFSVIPANIQTGFYETSDLTLTNPVWTISQTPGRISLNKVPDETTIETYNEESTICKSLFPMKDALFVIPQGVSSDITVELTYSQKNKGDTTIEGRLRSAASAHGYMWAPGRSYTYTFTLGVDDFIIFDKPDVSAWDEDEGGNYIVVG